MMLHFKYEKEDQLIKNVNTTGVETTEQIGLSVFISL